MMLCLTIWAVVPQAWASPNTAPTFVGGNTSLPTYRDASATDIGGLLHVSDIDNGQTLTWSSASAPTHGTLFISTATASSGGTDITPGGTITYAPAAGYSGPDSFTVQVSDGINTAQRVISVSINNGTGTAGSSPPSSVDNTQPTAALTWVILKQGIFPSRDPDGTAPSDGYIGEIRLISFDTAKLTGSAWLPCDGRLLPIVQNQAMFALLGTTYGGNGVTTFGIPDLRGRVPVGIGPAPDLTEHLLGENDGSEAFTLTVNNLPTHRHTTATGNTGFVGNNVPIDNMQPWLALNFCVVTSGDTDSSLGWVRIFAFNFTPGGFHACDGALLSVQDNPVLFSKLDTTFGGDGTSTFALPDLRGRTPIASGENHFLGEIGGSEQIALTTQEMPTHAHAYPGGTTGFAGGNQAHDTLQPFLALEVDVSPYGVYGQVGTSDPAVGEVRFFTGNYWRLNEDWLACDGSLQSIADQEVLFNLIDVTWGGDGQETFAMPNCSDRAVADVGQGIGLTSRVLGNLWGNESVTVNLSQLPAHFHTVNAIPSDISLSLSSVDQSAGVNAVIGSLSTTDSDGGDPHTYSLVSGTGPTDNALFNISGTNLRANNASAMAAGNYSVRIQTDDGSGGVFQKAFTITVVDSTAPAAPTAFSAVATGGNVALSWANPGDTDFASVTIRRSLVGFPTSPTDGALVAQGVTGTSQADNGLSDGTYYYSIFALDTAGNFSVAAHATATIDTTPPAITSILTDDGTYGAEFTYTITANGSPVSFDASSLPDGLTVNTNTGAIFGTPTQAGSFNVILSAADSYANVGHATLVLSIAKASASISLGNLSQTYDGSGHFVSASTTPEELAVSVTYNDSSDAPTNTGSYIVIATITNPNYTGAATNTLIIAPQAAIVTLGDLSQTYDGTAKSASALTTPNGLAVDLTYEGSTNAPTNAGSYTVIATLTDTNYAGSATNTLVIAPQAAIVMLSDLSQTYAGTGKTVSVSTTPSELAVTLTYEGSADAPTNAGSYTVIATITNPNYAGSATNTLVITPQAAAVVLANLSQTYDGTGKTVSVSTTPSELAVTLTYEGSADAPTNAGSYTVIATVTNPNYAGSATNTFVIAPQAATVVLGNLSQTYDGTGKSISVSTTPNELAVSLTYEGSADAPTNAGNYTVIATVTNPNYTGSATNTLVIAPATATVVLGNLSQTYDGTGKSVSVSTTPSELAVTLTYEGSTDAPTNAGSYTVIATVIDTNYAGSATNTLVIAPATATVVLGNLSQSYDSAGKSASVSTTPEGLTVNLTYNGSTDVPTNAGSYLAVGTITDVNYQGATTNTLTIAQHPLTVAADNKTRAYGEADPIFTGTITGAVLSDDLSATYTTTATATSQSGGTYPIVPSLVDPNGKAGNYIVTTNNGTLTITTLPLILHLEVYSTNPPPVIVDPCHPIAFPMDESRLTAAAEVGRTYSILTSTNFTDWSVLTNITVDTNGTLEFIDKELQQHPTRYFRAVTQ